MSNSVVLLGQEETFCVTDDVIGGPVAQAGRLTRPEHGALDLMLEGIEG